MDMTEGFTQKTCKGLKPGGIDHEISFLVWRPAFENPK